MAKDLQLSDDQLEELRRTGAPLLLPIDDSEIVVQDAESYRRMLTLLDQLDLARSGETCAERWQALQRGDDRGLSPEDFFADIKQRLRRAG